MVIQSIRRWALSMEGFCNLHREGIKTLKKHFEGKSPSVYILWINCRGLKKDYLECVLKRVTSLSDRRFLMPSVRYHHRTNALLCTAPITSTSKCIMCLCASLLRSLYLSTCWLAGHYCTSTLYGYLPPCS